MNIRKLVTQTLTEAFPHIPIYRENVEQGFNSPYFFVKQQEQKWEKQVNNRYLCTTRIDVHYVSEKEDKNDDYEQMSERLYEVLIYLGKTCRGHSMNDETVDGVLRFHVSYITRLEKVVKQQEMKSLSLEDKVEDGN